MANSGTQLERSMPLPLAGNQLLSNLRSGWNIATSLWLSWPAPRKRGITIAVTLSGLMLSGILWYGLRTDWSTLFAGLDPEDARETGLVLTQAQIPFEVASNGTIRVPAAQLDKARLATSAKGAIKSGRLGFELFDNLPVHPTVLIGEGMQTGDCRIETEFGSADLGIETQLEEITREFFELQASGEASPLNGAPLTSPSSDDPS